MEAENPVAARATPLFNRSVAMNPQAGGGAGGALLFPGGDASAIGTTLSPGMAAVPSAAHYSEIAGGADAMTASAALNASSLFQPMPYNAATGGGGGPRLAGGWRGANAAGGIFVPPCRRPWRTASAAPGRAAQRTATAAS